MLKISHLTFNTSLAIILKIHVATITEIEKLSERLLKKMSDVIGTSYPDSVNNI
jgi:hypothetical protein